MKNNKLIIVESPTKAKTISKFLDSSYKVIASMGHIRDLPSDASEIPAKYKSEAWSRLGIDVNNNFNPLYVIPLNKKEQVKKLKDAVKDADEIFLATDEDREGESISWHILEILNIKSNYKRMVFHEITKDAIYSALENPRELDENLVKAQETRRIVDRLYGYSVSPVLWKKIKGKLSAGRVQSIAIKLLVEREKERIRFIPAEYLSLSADFNKPSEKDKFGAILTHLNSSRIAVASDFDSETGKLPDKKDISILTKSQAEEIEKSLIEKPCVIESIDKKNYSKTPPAPFTTSTLQQEANAKFRFSAKHTMSVAQKLYENGHITYMRTDSTILSDQAIKAARKLIQSEYGNDYLSKDIRTYTTKVKNAQEAHEAIRPAGDKFIHPSELGQSLGIDAFKLYDLIWKRTVACQMADEKGVNTVIIISCDNAKFKATGKTTSFPGFQRAYVEGSEDPEAKLEERDSTFPELEKNQNLDASNIKTSIKTTNPPNRYSEGSLIKELEKLGIGRPSTWATIVDVVLNRNYAYKKGNALIPSFIAIAVVNLLDKHFSDIIDYQYTAKLEDDLDNISKGEADCKKYLEKFYFGDEKKGLKELVELGEKNIDPREVCGLIIGDQDEKSENKIEVRIGKFGAYLTNQTEKTSIPENISPDELTLEKAKEILKDSTEKQEKILGYDPETNKPIYLKNGRFGPYVQLGENSKEEKSKMTSLMPNDDFLNISLEYALKLLSYPLVIGKNNKDNEDITVALGKFGPYIKSGKASRSIPSDIPVLEITLEQAISLLEQPVTRNRRTASKSFIKELGLNPINNKSILIKDGRFGPYVTDGVTNCSLSKGTSIEEISLDECITMLEEKALSNETLGKTTKKTRSSSPKKKTTGKNSKK